jgi:hypothetical protein
MRRMPADPVHRTGHGGRGAAVRRAASRSSRSDGGITSIDQAATVPWMEAMFTIAHFAAPASNICGIW